MGDEENDDLEGFSPDEMIVRKKKAPEAKTGTEPAEVLKKAADSLAQLRAKKPLVQCITNIVAAEFTANALLALDASPAMIEDMGEATQFATVADGILVNTGTVTKPQTEAMRAAVSRANMGGRPWLLDPVAVGALPLRTFISKELMRRFPAIIRGNASEIAFLAGSEAYGRGVDAQEIPAADIVTAASRLSRVTRAAVLVSGAVDYVAAEGAPVLAVKNGTPLLARITASGCVQGALGAAFLGALGGKARWEAALAAALTLSVAGEIAAAKAKNAGSFRVALVDALDALKPDDILKRGKVAAVN